MSEVGALILFVTHRITWPRVRPKTDLGDYDLEKPSPTSKPVVRWQVITGVA